MLQTSVAGFFKTRTASPAASPGQVDKQTEEETGSNFVRFTAVEAALHVEQPKGGIAIEQLRDKSTRAGSVSSRQAKAGLKAYLRWHLYKIQNT